MTKLAGLDSDELGKSVGACASTFRLAYARCSQQLVLAVSEAEFSVIAEERSILEGRDLGSRLLRIISAAPALHLLNQESCITLLTAEVGLRVG